MSVPPLMPAAAPMTSAETTSKTPLASGWSPFFGGSPPMKAMFRTPSAHAPSRSAWIAIRFRSRLVICMIGSSPWSSSRWETAIGAIAMRAAWESVTLNASTWRLRPRARSRSESSDVPFGGVSSLVTTNPSPSSAVFR